MINKAQIVALLMTAACLPGQAAKEKVLTVPPGKTVALKPGDHTFQRVKMGENSMLLVADTTRLLIRKMETMGDVRIQYKKGSNRRNPQKKLEVSILDGTNMRGILRLIGTGADSANAANGRNGSHGGDEHFQIKRFKIRKTRPSRGGNGAAGASGQNGEDGMHIRLSVLKAHPNALFAVTSNGGDGGAGGHGGAGGNGGRGKRFYRGEPGGDGGVGGRGGNGGDAGNVVAVIVHREDATPAQIKQAKKFLDKNIIALPGHGGRGGACGHGGNGGGGGKGGRVPPFRRGSGDGGKSGASGTPGYPGKSGTAVKKLQPFAEWMLRYDDLLDRLLSGKQFG